MTNGLVLCCCSMPAVSVTRGGPPRGSTTGKRACCARGGVGLGFARFCFAPPRHTSAGQMTQPAVLVEDRSTGFLRELGLLDSTMIVAGSMIGSGIFIVSADIARQVGSAGGLILTWVITGLLTITAALSYGELAAMMPAAGGQYVY